MRSGEVSTAKKTQNQTSRDNILKITGSPISGAGQTMQVNINAYDGQNTIRIPPLAAPSPTYAYQVSQLTGAASQAQHASGHHHHSGNQDSTPKSPRKNPKVVVTNQRGSIHQSASRDVLNDDMREVFSAGSNLA